MEIDDLKPWVNPNPIISVIMCVYNTPLNKLEEALSSVSYQQFKDYEIIIIDDCSDKETVHYLNKFKHNWTIDLRPQQLSIYHNKENKGLAASRNYGISKAKGEWIYFIDSDDYMWGLTLKKMFEVINLWEATTDYELDMVIGDCTRADVRVALGSETGNGPIYYDRYDALKEICSFSEVPSNMYKSHELQFNACWNKLIRKSVFDNIEFKEGYPYEDNFTMHKILYNCSGILFLPIQTYLYRYGGMFVDGKQYKDIYIVQAKEERQEFLEEWYNEVIDNQNYLNEDPIKLPPGFTKASVWKSANLSCLSKIDYLINNNYAWIMYNMYRYYCTNNDKSVFKDILVRPTNGDIDLSNVQCKSLFKRIKTILERDDCIEEGI